MSDFVLCVILFMCYSHINHTDNNVHVKSVKLFVLVRK